MTKPNTKTSRAPKPVAKPAEPSGEAMFDDAPQAPVVPADQAGEVVQETLPDEALAADGIEEVQEEPAVLEVLEEQVSDAEPDGEQLFDDVFGEESETVNDTPVLQPAPPPEPAVSSDGPEKVRLGQVEGLLSRVPVETVQAILGEPALERLGHLRSSESIHDLQRRMRVTDGRCAPMIFTDNGEQAPILFSGIDSFAAAINLGLRNISVITISPTDASAAQSWVTQQQAKRSDPDDDMIHRVYALNASLA